jgi:ribose 1,5-bisphosphokinase PhnN
MRNRMGSSVSALTSRHIIKVMREQYAVGICSCDSASMKVLALALEMR